MFFFSRENVWGQGGNASPWWPMGDQCDGRCRNFDCQCGSLAGDRDSAMPNRLSLEIWIPPTLIFSARNIYPISTRTTPNISLQLFEFESLHLSKEPNHKLAFENRDLLFHINLLIYAYQSTE